MDQLGSNRQECERQHAKHGDHCQPKGYTHLKTVEFNCLLENYFGSNISTSREQVCSNSKGFNINNRATEIPHYLWMLLDF